MIWTNENVDLRRLAGRTCNSIKTTETDLNENQKKIIFWYFCTFVFWYLYMYVLLHFGILVCIYESIKIFLCNSIFVLRHFYIFAAWILTGN